MISEVNPKLIQLLNEWHNSFLYRILVGAELRVKRNDHQLEKCTAAFVLQSAGHCCAMSDATVLQYREVTEMLSKKNPSNHGFHVLGVQSLDLLQIFPTERNT